MQNGSSIVNNSNMGWALGGMFINRMLRTLQGDAHIGHVTFLTGNGRRQNRFSDDKNKKAVLSQRSPRDA